MTIEQAFLIAIGIISTIALTTLIALICHLFTKLTQSNSHNTNSKNYFIDEASQIENDNITMSYVLNKAHQTGSCFISIDDDGNISEE